MMWFKSTRKQQRASTESSGNVMQAVQGGDLGCDSSSYGPTDELRSKYMGCSTPTKRGVVDSSVQESSSEAMRQCSGWLRGGRGVRAAVSGLVRAVLRFDGLRRVKVERFGKDVKKDVESSTERFSAVWVDGTSTTVITLLS